jgi:hypothetical protein
VAVGPALRGRLPAALALALLAGCAPAPWSFSRPGITPLRLDQDLEHCRREAHRPYRFALTRSGRVDQQALRLCMERKGYTVRRASE